MIDGRRYTVKSRGLPLWQSARCQGKRPPPSAESIKPQYLVIQGRRPETTTWEEEEEETLAAASVSPVNTSSASIRDDVSERARRPTQTIVRCINNQPPWIYMCHGRDPWPRNSHFKEHLRSLPHNVVLGLSVCTTYLPETQLRSTHSF